MQGTGEGYNVGHPQKFLRALLQNAATSGKDPSLKAKLPPAYLDLLATSLLIDSCTRKYRDWMEAHLAPKGDERAAPEKHFVWLSKDYTPYDTDLGSPFVPPDFTLGLPPVKDWPRQVREPPWVLDPEGCPKSSRNVPVDSTSSMDEGKKKKKKKHRRSKKTENPELKVTTGGEGADTPVWTHGGPTKDSSSTSDYQSEGDSGLGSMDEGKKKKKHRRSKKTENPELKVTTQGEGADTPVWTHGGPTKDSSSTSDYQSEGDSGLGSNPSIISRQDTDTEPWRGASPCPSPDHTQQPADDDPLSDQGEGDGDQEMPDAPKQQGKQQGVNNPADPKLTPDETQEGVLLGDDQVETGDGEEPEEPEEPREPYQIVLQGFWTISQTLSVAYGAASSKIQTVVQKSLAKATAEDRTFVWGASGAICRWLDSVKLAMAATEEDTKDQARLLAEARQAGKDALDAILEFIPEEPEQEAHLTSVFHPGNPSSSCGISSVPAIH